jgi:hypothetical protein
MRGTIKNAHRNLVWKLLGKMYMEERNGDVNIILRWILGRETGRREVANILNKQSRTADKRWSSSLGVGRGANNSSP